MCSPEILGKLILTLGTSCAFRSTKRSASVVTMQSQTTFRARAAKPSSRPRQLCTFAASRGAGQAREGFRSFRIFLAPVARGWLAPVTSRLSRYVRAFCVQPAPVAESDDLSAEDMAEDCRWCADVAARAAHVRRTARDVTRARL